MECDVRSRIIKCAYSWRYQPTAESPTMMTPAQLAVTRGILASPSTSASSAQPNAVYVDAYIVELSYPSVSEKSIELKRKKTSARALETSAKQQEVAVSTQQSRFLSTLPTSVKAKNASVRAASRLS